MSRVETRALDQAGRRSRHTALPLPSLQGRRHSFSVTAIPVDSSSCNVLLSPRRGRPPPSSNDTSTVFTNMCATAESLALAFHLPPSMPEPVHPVRVTGNGPSQVNHRRNACSLTACLWVHTKGLVACCFKRPSADRLTHRYHGSSFCPSTGSQMCPPAMRS